ncbi:MAG: phosphatidate cytidylyltransferase [Proteobacteria bacterium]|nr:phosphatidate cytidylyltransferase [Pseudomonadota bacterium]
MENPETPSATAPASKWAGLKTRVISGVALAVVALVALRVGGWLFIALVVAAGAQMIREWDGLCLKTESACPSKKHKLAGVLYVALPCASLIWLRCMAFPATPEAGFKVVLYLILVVCATDIGAFFAGRRIGGPKLAPTISPNKTWAGLGGGMISAAVVGAACSSFTPYPPSIIACMDLGALLALIAQGGDLFESWLKRRAGVKDSGCLIPGHGGLLDRVDGLIFTMPLFAWFVAMGGVSGQ